MPRALLAWEGGDGRGHISNLKAVAEYIGDRFSFDASICRQTYRAELESVCDLVLVGPSFRYSGKTRAERGAPPSATWGEFLGDIGFREEAALSARIGWWQKVIRERNISLVVADFAPCALMAARGMGIATAVVGDGYSAPPHTLAEYPVLLPEFDRRIYDEAEMAAIVNAAAGQFGVPGITHLPEIYKADARLVFTLPMLDPYLDSRTEPLLPPVGTDEPVARSPGGDEIFVYFSVTRGIEVPVVESLANLGLPLRVYMPSLRAEDATLLASKGCIIEPRPLHVTEIARRSRVMLNWGAHGTLCMGLAAGIPQVLMPYQLEQLHKSRCAEKAGVVRVADPWTQTVDSVRDAVLSVYHDGLMEERARHLAAEIRPFFNTSRRKQVRRRLDFA